MTVLLYWQTEIPQSRRTGANTFGTGSCVSVLLFLKIYLLQLLVIFLLCSLMFLVGD